MAWCASSPLRVRRAEEPHVRSLFLSCRRMARGACCDVCAAAHTHICTRRAEGETERTTHNRGAGLGRSGVSPVCGLIIEGGRKYLQSGGDDNTLNTVFTMSVLQPRAVTPRPPVRCGNLAVLACRFGPSRRVAPRSGCTPPSYSRIPERAGSYAASSAPVINPRRHPGDTWATQLAGYTDGATDSVVAAWLPISSAVCSRGKQRKEPIGRWPPNRGYGDADGQSACSASKWGNK